MLQKKFLIILMLVLVPMAGGYILDVPPKPAQANDSIQYLDGFTISKR